MINDAESLLWCLCVSTSCAIALIVFILNQTGYVTW